MDGQAFTQIVEDARFHRLAVALLFLADQVFQLREKPYDPGGNERAVKLRVLNEMSLVDHFQQDTAGIDHARWLSATAREASVGNCPGVSSVPTTLILRGSTRMSVLAI